LDTVNDEQDAASAMLITAIDKKGDLCSVDVIKSGMISFEDWPLLIEVKN
jgi:hypothetical protein